eukprot:m.26660 g.26660  ORF g.26660 m.26660 type:complete len:433 (+) comp4634_c0_seq1:70-1368(+)
MDWGDAERAVMFEYMVRPRSVRTAQQRHLVLQLRDHLRRREFREAAGVLSIIANRAFDMPAVVGEAGSLVLQQLGYEERRITDFYTEIGALLQQPEEFNLELAIHLAHRSFSKALDHMETLVHMNPFAKNSVFRGHCAQLFFALSLELSNDRNALGYDADPRKMLKQAQINFEASLRADPTCDFFVAQYARLLEHKGDIDAVHDLLTKFQAQCPENPNSHRYLFAFYQRHEELEPLSTQMLVLRQLLECDPISHLGWIAVKHVMEGGHGVPDLELETMAINVVAAHIERSSAASSATALPLWTEFARLLSRVPSSMLPWKSPAARRLRCWRGRLQWWQTAYFSRFTLAEDSTDVTNDSRLDAVKALCAARIYGEDNPMTEAAWSILDDHPPLLRYLERNGLRHPGETQEMNSDARESDEEDEEDEENDSDDP